MAGLGDFPQDLYARVFANDTEHFVGSVSNPTVCELKNMRFWLYFQGTATGSEQIRFKVYPNDRLLNPIATSEWVTASSISNLGSNWLGRVRFDLTTPMAMAASRSYYVTLEITNYSRIGDTRYIAWILDWPIPVSTGINSGAYMELYGFE